MKSEHRHQRKLQIGAAALGVGVLIAMDAITVAGSGDSVTTSAPPTSDTSTSTTPPSTPTTTKAKPQVTASTSQGEWPETSVAEPAE